MTFPPFSRTGMARLTLTPIKQPIDERAEAVAMILRTAKIRRGESDKPEAAKEAEPAPATQTAMTAAFIIASARKARGEG
jgi:hypothetical protein